MHCGSLPGWRVRWGEGGRLKSGLIGSRGLPPCPAPLGRPECGRRSRPSCSRVCAPETRLPGPAPEKGAPNWGLLAVPVSGWTQGPTCSPQSMSLYGKRVSGLNPGVRLQPPYLCRLTFW